MCNYANNCKKYQIGTCISDNFCIRKFKKDEIFKLGLIEEAQRGNIRLFLYENDPDEEENEFSKLKCMLDNIGTFVDSGTNLYLYSENCGNGKTSWALKLAQAYVEAIWPEVNIDCHLLFINVPKFLLELKKNISVHSDYIEHIYNYVREVPLVIWDDVGSKCGTEFEIENMLSLINSRLDSRKSNIYTSNIPPEYLSQVLGMRLGSRLVGMSEVVHLRGDDKRGVTA